MSSFLLKEARRDGRICDVLVLDGRVAAIGDDLRAVGSGLDALGSVQVVEAGGAVLLPGLLDSHVHLTQWASARRRIDVMAATSPTQVADVLLAHAGPGSDLVLGHGYRDGLWSEPAHRDVLDARFPDRPVVVVSMDLHAAWLNSAAAARFGVDEPSGVLREAPAMELFAAVGEVEATGLDRRVAEATAAAAARGVTGIVDLEYAPIDVWARRENPSVRVAAGIWPDWLDAAISAGLRTGDAVPGAPERVRVGPVKYVVDGSLGTRTAFCHEEYPSGGHGMLRIPLAELEPALRRATSHGLTVAVHAIGDDAVRVALDGFEATGCVGTLEHAQQVHPDDVARFAGLGVTASIQPRHAVDDRDAVELHWAKGSERAYPYASLHAAGARLLLGSDAPVAPLDPWDAMASAVHRSIDDRAPWRPEQHLPLDVALAASTGGRDGVHVGDVADLVLVAVDPAQAFAAGGAAALRATEVLATVLGGEFTHRDGI